MRRRVLRRLIWVYAICKCSLFGIILHKCIRRIHTNFAYVEFWASYAPVILISFHRIKPKLEFGREIGAYMKFWNAHERGRTDGRTRQNTIALHEHSLAGPAPCIQLYYSCQLNVYLLLLNSVKFWQMRQPLLISNFKQHDFRVPFVSDWRDTQ